MYMFGVVRNVHVWENYTYMITSKWFRFIVANIYKIHRYVIAHILYVICVICISKKLKYLKNEARESKPQATGIVSIITESDIDNKLKPRGIKVLTMRWTPILDDNYLASCSIWWNWTFEDKLDIYARHLLFIIPVIF